MMGDEMAEAWAGGYREGTSCWATAELMRELRCQVARGRSQIECTQEQLVVVMGYLYFLAGEIWQVLKYRRGRAVTDDTTRAHTPARRHHRLRRRVHPRLWLRLWLRAERRLGAIRRAVSAAAEAAEVDVAAAAAVGGDGGGGSVAMAYGMAYSRIAR